MANNFVTIQYDTRDFLGLTNNQYIVCDLVNKMSQNDDKWTKMRKETFANKVGVSTQALLDLLKKVQSMELIERHPTDFRFKSTQKWVKIAVEVDFSKEGKETLPIENEVKKLDPQGKETLPQEVKKLYPTGKETLPLYKVEKKREKKEEKERERESEILISQTLTPSEKSIESLKADLKEHKEVSPLSLENKLSDNDPDAVNDQQTNNEPTKNGYKILSTKQEVKTALFNYLSKNENCASLEMDYGRRGFKKENLFDYCQEFAVQFFTSHSLCSLSESKMKEQLEKWSFIFNKINKEISDTEKSNQTAQKATKVNISDRSRYAAPDAANF